MSLPPRLLKFTPEPRFLENGMFRFTQPSDLNDPYEAYPGLLVDQFGPDDIAAARTKALKDGHSHMSDEMLAAFYLTPFPARRFDEKGFPGLWPNTDLRLRTEPFSTLAEYDRAVAERAVELGVAFANRTIGIFSLSERADETMWAHYADDHRGVCIEFDPTHPFFTDESPKAIKYSDQPFQVTVNHGWVRFGGERLSQDALLDNKLDFFPEEILWRKRSTWAYEKEWRMTKVLSDADHIIQPDRPGDFPICLFRIPCEAVLAITFGLRAGDEEIQKTLATVARDVRWSHLTFRRRHRSSAGIVETALVRRL